MASVLITGANRGIGLALAQGYARDGWMVHACCRHPDKSKKLKAIGGNLTCHRLDVTDALQVAGLARGLRDEAIDVLINNAGISGPSSDFGKTDYEAWAEVFAVNTMAPMRLAEQFADHLARSDRKVLANISSRLGSLTANDDGGRYLYRSSKGALNMVGKSLSIDLADRGIVVLQLHPGWVRTDMGGEEAPVSSTEAAAGLRGVIAGATVAETGRFFNYDGAEIPW